MFLIICVLTPIQVYWSMRKHWWKWATLAKFKSLDWTEEELLDAVDKARINDDTFFYKLKKLLDVKESTSEEV